MEAIQELGFSTSFVDGEGTPPALAASGPIVVYSIAVGVIEVPELRRVWLASRVPSSLVASTVVETAAVETKTEILSAPNVYRKSTALALQARTSRMRAAQLSQRRFPKQPDTRLSTEVLNHMRAMRLFIVERRSHWQDSGHNVIEARVGETSSFVPKQRGRRLCEGDRTSAIAEQAEMRNDLKPLRKARLASIAGAAISRVDGSGDVSKGRSSFNVATETWISDMRMAHFKGVRPPKRPQIGRKADNLSIPRRPIQPHPDSSPVGLARQDLSDFEVEMLALIKSQTIPSTKWIEDISTTDTAVRLNDEALSSADRISQLRIDYFEKGFRSR
jgi:hypothetical protein